MGMLSENQARLVSSFLQAKEQEQLDGPQDLALMPAKQGHEGVEAEVAFERAQYTETGVSSRDKELLTNIGRLEDQLEAYRRLGPTLHRHLEMQAATAKSLKALEAKSAHIEEMAATMWWDSKMLMCIVTMFGFALCGYVSFLDARQNSAHPTAPRIVFANSAKRTNFEAAAPKAESPANCEYFSLNEEPGAAHTAEDDWWMQPTGSEQRPAAAVEAAA